MTKKDYGYLSDLLRISKDTRDKLEADVRRTIELEGWQAKPNELGADAFQIIMNLLDRQAAITEREVAQWEQTRTLFGMTFDEVRTIQARNTELEAELDMMHTRFANLDACHRTALNEKYELQAKLEYRESELKRLKREDEDWATVPYDKLTELESENAELREKLSEAMGNAYKTIRLLDLEGKCV